MQLSCSQVQEVPCRRESSLLQRLETRILTGSCKITFASIVCAHGDQRLTNLLSSWIWLKRLKFQSSRYSHLAQKYGSISKDPSGQMSNHRMIYRNTHLTSSTSEKTISTMAFSEISLNPQTFAMRTYGDLKKVVECLRLDRSKPRKTVMANLEAVFPESNDSQRQRSIELAARLCLMIHMKSPIGPTVPSTPLTWLDDEALTEAFKLWLPKCHSTSRQDKSRIAFELAVVSLRKLRGVTILWTPNLKDHLEYQEKAGTLQIFSHKICLQSHWELEQQEIKQHGLMPSTGEKKTESIFPEGSLDETIRTLDLLFPFGDDRTKEYLEHEGQLFYGLSLPRHSQSVSADLNDFRYWQDRLTVLYDVLDRPPSRFCGMWTDRRNRMQWWTFWLAVFFSPLTLVFGVAGLILGFKQLRLSQKAHALAVSQACVQPVKPTGLC